MNGNMIGSEGTATVEVTGANTAASIGNEGVDVFATPFMVGLAEEAARKAVDRFLPPGTITLGGWIEMKHLAPTPPGFPVTARARIVEVKGSKYTFEFEVFDGAGKVGEGRHVRFAVPREKFLETVAGRKSSLS